MVKFKYDRDHLTDSATKHSLIGSLNRSSSFLTIKKKRRERNHQMFLSAGMLTQSGLVDKVTGKPNYDPERLIQSFTRFNEKLKKGSNKLVSK